MLAAKITALGMATPSTRTSSTYQPSCVPQLPQSQPARKRTRSVPPTHGVRSNTASLNAGHALFELVNPACVCSGLSQVTANVLR